MKMGNLAVPKWKNQTFIADQANHAIQTNHSNPVKRPLIIQTPSVQPVYHLEHGIRTTKHDKKKYKRMTV